MKVKNDIFAAIVFSIIQCTFSEHILPCNVTSMGTCPGRNQICKQRSSLCDCIDGYEWVDDECVQETPSSNSVGHDVTAAAVSIFTIALIVCGLVLVVKRYNLIDYIRHKINQRRNNDIMYEDVMIGQDDPPLNP